MRWMVGSWMSLWMTEPYEAFSMQRLEMMMVFENTVLRLESLHQRLHYFGAFSYK